mmetsp:Transcript_6146/g.14403  ORF Transcript_6146/g.14403 Transcript_6146/m.14403 type:complete len:481 (-) Transcript_6146:315-1757(-)
MVEGGRPRGSLQEALGHLCQQHPQHHAPRTAWRRRRPDERRRRKGRPLHGLLLERKLLFPRRHELLQEEFPALRRVRRTPARRLGKMHPRHPHQLLDPLAVSARGPEAPAELRRRRTHHGQERRSQQDRDRPHPLRGPRDFRLVRPELHLQGQGILRLGRRPNLLRQDLGRGRAPRRSLRPHHRGRNRLPHHPSTDPQGRRIPRARASRAGPDPVSRQELPRAPRRRFGLRLRGAPPPPLQGRPDLEGHRLRHQPPHVRPGPQGERRTPGAARRRRVDPRGAGRVLFADVRRRRVGRRGRLHGRHAPRGPRAAAQGRSRGRPRPPTRWLDDLQRHHAGRSAGIRGGHAAHLRPDQSLQDGNRIQLQVRAGRMRFHQLHCGPSLRERSRPLRKGTLGDRREGSRHRALRGLPHQGEGRPQGLERKVPRKYRLGHHRGTEDRKGLSELPRRLELIIRVGVLACVAFFVLSTTTTTKQAIIVV